jgi:hypothetical protein
MVVSLRPHPFDPDEDIAAGAEIEAVVGSLDADTPSYGELAWMITSDGLGRSIIIICGNAMFPNWVFRARITDSDEFHVIRRIPQPMSFVVEKQVSANANRLPF